MFDSDSETYVTSTTLEANIDALGNVRSVIGNGGSTAGDDILQGNAVQAKIGDVSNSEVYQNFEGVVDKSTSNVSNITGDNNDTHQLGSVNDLADKSTTNKYYLFAVMGVIVILWLIYKLRKKRK